MWKEGRRKKREKGRIEEEAQCCQQGAANTGLSVLVAGGPNEIFGDDQTN